MYAWGISRFGSRVPGLRPPKSSYQLAPVEEDDWRAR